MRSNYLQPCLSATRLIEDDSTHSLPISQMGNYQDYLKKMPTPLREIESQPVRQHMFGNPFKINKNMILDEVVDEVPGAGGMSPGGMGGMGQGQGPGMGMGGGKMGKRQNAGDIGLPPHAKRAKKGPLPKDYVYRRTPPSTPTHESDYSISPPGTPSHPGMEDMPVQPPVELPPQVSPLISTSSEISEPPPSPPLAPPPADAVPLPIPGGEPAPSPVAGLAALVVSAGGGGGGGAQHVAQPAGPDLVPEVVPVNGVSGSDFVSSNSYSHNASSVGQSPANYSDSDSDEEEGVNEPPPSLARAASFSLNQSQEDLMASEIAGKSSQ